MADDIMMELERAPLPDIIRGLAFAIGDAQMALDQNSIRQLKMMADPDNGVSVSGENRSLLQLGLVPSFYHFSESTIEAKVAFTMMKSHEISVSATAGVQIKVFTASITASYTNKYSFEASGSSVISTKLVSVPPPAALSELVSRMAAKTSK